MTYYLALTHRPIETEQWHALESAQGAIIGRGEGAHVRLPDDDTSVLPQHAVAELLGGRVRLRALSPAHPIYVNGEPLERALLTTRDAVRIGRTELRLIQLQSGSEPGVDFESDDVHASRGPLPAPRLGTPPGFGDEITAVAEGSAALSRFGAARALQESQDEGIESPWTTLDGSTDPALPMVAFSVDIECVLCGASRGAAPPPPSIYDGMAWLCADCIAPRRRLGPGHPASLGRYELLRPLAEGGMGAVYEAVDAELGFRAAVKVLRSSLVGNPTIVRRFIKEQRLASELYHPRIVRCFDVGQDEDTRQLYVAAEFVPAGDGASFASPTAPLRDALHLGADLFEALSILHARHFIHRDIKPENLLLTAPDETGSPRGKLADFGLAKSLLEQQGISITHQGESAGTPLFVAPEQVRNFKSSGPSVDVYGAAGTLYFLLTGRGPLDLPVPEDDLPLPVILGAVVGGGRVPISSLRPDLPRAAAVLIDGLVAQSPLLRSRRGAAEIAVELRSLAAVL